MNNISNLQVMNADGTVYETFEVTNLMVDMNDPECHVIEGNIVDVTPYQKIQTMNKVMLEFVASVEQAGDAFEKLSNSLKRLATTQERLNKLLGEHREPVTPEMYLPYPQPKKKGKTRRWGRV